MPTAEYYLGGIRALVGEAERKWRELVLVMVDQYESALNDHEAVLKQVKGKIELRKKQEDERHALALSIITAGLLGPYSKALSTHIDDQGKAAAKGLHRSLVEGQGSIVMKLHDKAMGALESLGSISDSPQTTIDGFSPAGMSASSYWRSLEKGLNKRFLILAESAESLWKSHSAISEPIAAAMYKSFEDRCYGNIRQIDPNSASFQRLLKDHAESALWIAWLRGRDLEYWIKQNRASMTYMQGSESYDWSVLAQTFQRKSLPIAVRSVFGGPQVGMIQIVDMPHAITFARTPLAYSMVAAPMARLTRSQNEEIVNALASITVM